MLEKRKAAVRYKKHQAFRGDHLKMRVKVVASILDGVMPFVPVTR